MVIIAYKPVGVTCGEFIKQFTDYTKKAYSGRLDPMAHGQMVILTDDEVKNQDDYHKLDKTYVFKFVIGINTDTDDILGLTLDNDKDIDIPTQMVVNAFNEFEDIYDQQYHKFSSFVPKEKCEEDGKRKPLWWWSKNGVTIPDIRKKPVTIYDRSIIGITKTTGDILKEEIMIKLEQVTSIQLRKDEIIEQWNRYEFANDYNMFECQITVSSGFYVRQFVKDISDLLNVRLLVTDIHRINVNL